ncbi:replication-associated recombination protein A [Thermoproteota archaeon]
MSFSSGSNMLFDTLQDNTDTASSRDYEQKVQPLAWRLAPQNFTDYMGQEHLISEAMPLRILIENDALTSIILWGPPGCGKTALSRLISFKTQADYLSINAVTAKLADIKACIDKGRQNLKKSKKTILFIDEIHRFNKIQQDALLPDVERGGIILIGATTENPFFSVIPGLISRSQIFQLYALENKHLKNILDRALLSADSINIDPDASDFIIQQAKGDARKLLNLTEMACQIHKSGSTITLSALETLIQQSGRGYGADDHYDLVSALIKSMRGSDPDASIYWLSRMLDGGEDPEFITRRLIIFASEDIGNADPNAFLLAVSLLHAVKFIGMPEIRINLAQVVTYLATAPKSNAAYNAVNEAMRIIKSGTIYPVPDHLKDSSYSGAKKMGFGKSYIYPHDNPDGTFVQRYIDNEHRFYKPKDIGYEKTIKKRLDFLMEKRSSGSTNNAVE